MLSLMDSVEIENLALFRDDEDARKFYLLPDEPVIPVDDKGVPDFFFIKYMFDAATTPDGAPAGGGYIQLRTVLTIAADRQQRVLTALRAQLAQEQQAGKKPLGNAITSTEPLLAAPLWTGGTVKLETFKVGDKELVVSDTPSVPVDLAGSLGASANLQLSPDGADIFWTSFQHYSDQQIPILISYQLTYKARVSATMTIHADRSTVESQIWEHANPRPYRFDVPRARWFPLAFAGAFNKAALPTLQAQTQDRVAALVEPGALTGALHSAVTSGAIVVKINTDEAGSGQTASDPAGANSVQDSLLKVATDVLSGRVIPALFGENAPTQPAANSDADPTVAKQLLELKVDTKDTATTTFDIDLTSTSTIERQCNPSGPIHLLISDPATLASCFKELRLTDGFFGVMRVIASTAGVNFTRDGISMVQVFLRYDQVDEANPDKPRVTRLHDGVLKSDADTLHFPAFDLARDPKGSHKREYSFRTDVYYGDQLIKNDWATADGDTLVINPAAMGAVRVELTLTAPRAQVVSARVALRYQRADGETLTQSLQLTPDANKQSWFKATGEVARLAGPRPQQYDYQVVYDIGTSNITMPWATDGAEALELPGPFVKTVTFVLRPQGSFDGVANLSGDLNYSDPLHGYQVTRPYLLKSLSDSFTFDVPVMQGGPETVAFTARVNRSDGSAQPLPSGISPAGTVWIGELTADFLNVQVLTDLLDFDKDVQLAVVQLSYPHPDGTSPDQKTFTFSKANKGAQSWKVPLPAGWPSAYEANVKYIAYDRTKSSESHAKALTDAVLLLDREAH